MKIRIKFRKQGAMKFIGHLDIMRYFQKVMRRADVDICYSGGFSPHQIMSFAAPLGVGLLSNGEYLDIEVNSSEDSAAMVQRMNAVMSEGMEVLSFRRLPDDAKSAMSLVAAADYVLAFRPGKEPEDMDAFFTALDEFYRQDAIPITKKTKRGEKPMDLKPLIYQLRRVRAVPFDEASASADADGNDGPETLTAGNEGPEALTVGNDGSETLTTGNEGPEALTVGNDGSETLTTGNEGPRAMAAGNDGPETLAAGNDGLRAMAAGNEPSEASAPENENASGDIPVILSGAVTEPADAVFLRLCTGSTDNIKPELVMEAFYASAGRELAPFTFQAEREEVYAASGDEGNRRFVPLWALGEDIEQTDHHQD